jgi:LPS-assembly protein
MLVGLSHPQVRAQEVTTQAPVVTELPEAPVGLVYPVAKVVPESGEKDAVDAVIESETQSMAGSRFILDGGVVVTYGDQRVEADHVEYDQKTGDLTATGHVRATRARNNEVITASHGEVNLRSEMGRFYDVKGSVGMKQSGKRTVYASGNPFLFTGRMVVKMGPEEYEVHDGTVTSCQLPHPDWMLYAGLFTMDGEKARAKNSVFKLLNVPLFYLPYVTHPVDGEARQSGVLIPVVGESSSKGLVLGEQIYWAINRSTDLTVGAQYFSRRGWEQAATFRYRGVGDDMMRVHYSGLLDRGYVPTGGVYTNQGGEDFTMLARHDFSPATRVVGDVEYLSSYIYREAFTENFNQAVSSDILSIAYGVHEANGYEASVEADRYQGLKQVQTTVTPQAQVRIFHVPSLNLSTTDHPVGATGLRWNLDASATGLKRVQPNFVTGGIVERLDLHPEISYPISGGGWHVLPSLGVRETLYNRSRKTPYVPGLPPVEMTAGLNRADVEVAVTARAPVIERTFRSAMLEKMFGSEVKHTVEPSVTYRYVAGVGNFLNVLRFDDRDVVSDTNELEYGVTQRLFVRPGKRGPCGVVTSDVDAAPAVDEVAEPTAAVETCSLQNRERVSWRLTQKYFFDPRFGGAVLNGRRNTFDTTLSLSGVAFLTEPRDISPLISRLRMQASDKVDVEWDFDLDTGAKKFTSNNVLVDVHQGSWFSGLSYARLNAPGRFYTQGISSATSDFSQMRVLLGYGMPTKKGLSVAANAGLDLRLTSVQYGALQTAYNWDCCGLSVEYRKYELGSVRNENAYRFNFTLANIGTAGNLRRAERLF